jgi:hypothetical protein
MLFRPKTRHIHRLLWVSALGLAVAVIAQGVHLLLADPGPLASPRLKRHLTLDPGDFSEQRPRSARARVRGKVVGLAGALNPSIPVQAPPVETDTATPETPPAEEVSAGGPLAEEWLYDSLLFFAPGSERNQVVLARKDAAPTARTRRVVRRRTTRGRSARIQRARRAAAEPIKSLYLYESWRLDEDEGPTVWVVGITPEELVYEVEEEEWRRYRLARQADALYRQALAPHEDAPDEVGGAGADDPGEITTAPGVEEPDAQPRFRLGDFPDRRDRFEERHEDPEAEAEDEETVAPLS